MDGNGFSDFLSDHFKEFFFQWKYFGYSRSPDYAIKLNAQKVAGILNVNFLQTLDIQTDFFFIGKFVLYFAQHGLYAQRKLSR